MCVFLTFCVLKLGTHNICHLVMDVNQVNAEMFNQSSTIMKLFVHVCSTYCMANSWVSASIRAHAEKQCKLRTSVYSIKVTKKPNNN